MRMGIRKQIIFNAQNVREAEKINFENGLTQIISHHHQGHLGFLPTKFAPFLI